MSSRNKTERNRARKLKFRIWRRDGGCCVYCQRPVLFLPQVKSTSIRSDHYRWYFVQGESQRAVLRATLDHVQPIARQGLSTMENLKLACVRCNEARSAAPRKLKPRKRCVKPILKRKKKLKCRTKQNFRRKRNRRYPD